MELILVRHGETIGNVRQIVQGHMPGKLTKRGRNQIRRTALKLKDRNIDAIFSSDLGRAVNTAREIARFHNVPVIYSKELRERNMGRFEGKPKRLIDMYRNRLDLHETQFRPARGENYSDVKRRVRRFMGNVYKIHRKRTVLVVTHGVVIRALISIYTGVPIIQTSKLMLKNAGILILDIKGEKAREIEEDIFM